MTTSNVTEKLEAGIAEATDMLQKLAAQKQQLHAQLTKTVEAEIFWAGRAAALRDLAPPSAVETPGATADDQAQQEATSGAGDSRATNQ